MSTNQTSIESNLTPTSMQSNNHEAEQWLDDAIKSQPMYFGEPSERDFDPDSPINLSRFGFQKPNDIKVFLLSPAGDTVKAELGAQVALDEAIEEEQQFERREQEGLAQRLKAILLLWLIEKKGHAAAHLRELIEEQNTKSINQSKPVTPQHKSESTAPKANTALQQTFNSYTNAIKECQEQHQLATKEEAKLTEEFENLHQQKVALDRKHAIYMETIENFEENLDSYEKLTPEQIDDKIKELETELHAQTDEITTLLNSDEPGSEDKARELLHKQNALNLDLAQLIDLRAQKNEAKAFYNAQGVEVKTAKDAEFVVSSNKKIVEKDGTYYLLDKNADLNQLTPGQKAQAQSEFQKSRHELTSVKQAVVNTLKMEKEFHNLDARIDNVQAKTQEKRNEKMNLENKITLLQSVKASFMQQNPELGQENTPKPSPTFSGKAAPGSLPAPPQSVIKITNKIIPFFTPGISSKRIFDEIDEDKSTNKKDKKEIKDYFTKLLKLVGLGKIPSLAPLPDSTMQSLLQHMARFGADPTKPGLTSIKNPLDLQNDVKMAPPMDGPHPKFGPKSPIKTPAPEPEVKPFNPTPSPYKTGY